MKRLLIFGLLLGIVCGVLAVAGWRNAGNSQPRVCQPSKRRPEKRRPRQQKYLVQDKRLAGQEVS